MWIVEGRFAAALVSFAPDLTHRNFVLSMQTALMVFAQKQNV